MFFVQTLWHYYQQEIDININIVNIAFTLKPKTGMYLCQVK